MSLEPQHITSISGVCGGKPCISGTCIRVQDIVLRADAGDSPDEILAAFPHIRLSAIHAALAYYYDHREAIDRQIRESDALVARMQETAAAG
ncbi:MAG: DUF433 domain-containing protein [Tepidisphaerales bacterium]